MDGSRDNSDTVTPVMSWRWWTWTNMLSESYFIFSTLLLLLSLKLRVCERNTCNFRLSDWVVVRVARSLVCFTENCELLGFLDIVANSINSEYAVCFIVKGLRVFESTDGKEEWNGSVCCASSWCLFKCMLGSEKLHVPCPFVKCFGFVCFANVLSFLL